MKGLIFGLLLVSNLALAEAPRHGEFSDGKVFDENAGEFVTPLTFWRNYAELNGGLTWGESQEYPPYNEVKEFDLFLVQTAEGPCLMEFFHSRWRRANDVRRWNPQFNEVLGCGVVFD